MALRVLLADESSTIKKVFQLALQDFAVEVKSMNLGVDVLPVAQTFQPDIIFADVLLQKQSGYEVSAELKKDDHLRNTPVVLMWSGFMELDQDKFEASGANAQLEKPFDVQALRQLIQNLVPKVQNQGLSSFLEFPQIPELVKEKKMPEGESFEQVNLSGVHKPTSTPSVQIKDEDILADTPEDDKNRWEQEDLIRFQVDVPEDEAEADIPQVTYPNPEEQIDSGPMSPHQLPADGLLEENIPAVSSVIAPIEDETELELELEEAETKSKDNLPIDPSQIEKMVKVQVEEFMRDKVTDYLEEVIWKVVPELAERIIERELKRLLEKFEPQQYR